MYCKLNLCTSSVETKFIFSTLQNYSSSTHDERSSGKTNKEAKQGSKNESKLNVSCV